MKKKPNKTFEFLYLDNRYDSDDELRVRIYKGRTLEEACDKMLAFLKRRENESEDPPWIDEDAVEIAGQTRIEHFIGDHPLRDFC